MDQNKDYSEEIDEKNLNNEKNKKILVILIAVLLFGLTYYYYNNINQNTDKPEQLSKNQIDTNKAVNPSQLLALKQNKVNNQIVKANEVKKQIEEPQKPVISYNTLFPTDKASLLKLAFAKTGTVDPFTRSNSSVIPMPGMTSLKPFDGKLPTIGNLPLPPGFDGLPSLNGFPGLNPELGKLYKPQQDFITIKGFIGDKVIVSINGITDSLKINESFQDIKVVKVDSLNLTAKFERKGKIISKTIRSLTDKDENPNVELVKHKQQST